MMINNLLKNDTGKLIIQSAGEVVINENSVDSDFRLESNGNPNMIFVDAGNDRISVGSGSTYSMFNVISSNCSTSATKP